MHNTQKEKRTKFKKVIDFHTAHMNCLKGVLLYNLLNKKPF